MDGGQTFAASAGELLLGIDTCGPTGSVALGRMGGSETESPVASNLKILGEIELEARSYSSTLVSAVADLLKTSGVLLNDLAAIVAVHGPGSFTGVRVGLSAAKGLAEPSQIPVIAMSRLDVLAAKAGVEAAALDAHRGEVFLRITRPGSGQRAAGPIEILATAAEITALAVPPKQIAVCDDSAAALLTSVWSTVELVNGTPPAASDALRLAATRVRHSGIPSLAVPDLALLDGNYLRRSDAEIFGEAAEAKRR